MEKRYNPGTVEKKWEKHWEDKDYFSPQEGKEKSVFSMVMPPPNVTGILHMGHAFNSTLQDIVVRFKRLQGYEVLWIPGIDHAGIATQNVVEKQLAREGLDRDKLGREKFVEKVWQWKEKYGERIFAQLKSLGVSCSWKDKSFTMDTHHYQAVCEAFVRLYQQGYIYRGNYIINWCPRCQTALSDIEVEHTELKGKLHYIRYPFKINKKSPQDKTQKFLVVATTRPETMLGDTAVAVNPQDKRFKNMKGKILILPLVGREIPLIYDDHVDPKFGTGALKVTPAHSYDDFLISQRHNLAVINILNRDATINENGGKYQGLAIYEVRDRVLNDLKIQGYIEKVEDYTYRVGHCYRCGTPIEPYLSRQWFIKMKDLAREAIRAVKRREIKFTPSYWGKSYFNWLENIHDWCISRQIWWGHQIPVWYCRGCEEIIVSTSIPIECPQCSSTELKQEKDVLDTWFSSSLWPFSTLGWPNGDEKFNRFYPTSLLCSGWDILFFWVARMVMMGLKFTEKVPFHQVYIHPLIGDEGGEKMSKSRGNVVDPLKMMEKYGTDAFRFSLVALKTETPYLRFSEDRVKGYRNFANKIWNASRFCLMNLKDFVPSGELEDLELKDLCDRWIVSCFSKTVREVTEQLERFEFPQAAQLLYQFIWGEFCDWYIELVKPRLEEKDASSRYVAQFILYWVLRGTLKLLHPFMPFITEEIYQLLPEKREEKESIMVSSWPEWGKEDVQAEEEMEFLMQIISEIRGIKSGVGIPPQTRVDPFIKDPHDENLVILRENSSYIKNLVKANQLFIGKDISRPELSASSVVGSTEIFLPLKGLVKIKEERQRLKINLKKVNEQVGHVSKKLSSLDFLKKAPPEIVKKEKKRRKELELSREKLSRWLEEIR